jgi:hypothetical protein
MTRTNRIALLAALALLVALAGTALGNRAPVADTAAPPQADEQEEAPDDVAIQRVVDRLAARDIDVEPAQVRELAAEHGLGGAVRVLAWSAQGVSIEEVQQRRAEGQGWGVIARDLGVHPGIGSIMGNGGGHGREGAPGQQRDRGSDD